MPVLLAPRRLAERKYYFYTGPFVPPTSPRSYFSLAPSILFQVASFSTATVPLLEPPRRGLEITVSSCVRYLDRRGSGVQPLCEGIRAFVAWIYQNQFYSLMCLMLIDTRRSSVLMLYIDVAS